MIFYRLGVFNLFDFDRLNLLIEQSGIKKAFLAKQIGKKPVIFNDWAKGKSKPSDGDLIILAKCLHTTFDYISGKTDIKKETAQNEQSLTPAQQELLGIVSSLSAEEIKKVREYAEFVVSQHKK